MGGLGRRSRPTRRHGPPARTRINRTGRHQIERTRSHHIVISTREPDDAYDDLDGDWTPVDHWVETEERAPRRRLAGVDPRLVRIGAVAAAGLLMIPIALALRDEPADGMRAEAAAPTTTVAIAAPPVPAATPTTVAVPPPVTAAAARLRVDRARRHRLRRRPSQAAPVEARQAGVRRARTR